jgi:glutamine synthetase
MFKDFSEAASYVKDQKIKMVDLKYCDFWGKWHHVTISPTEFTPSLMTSGVGFDGSSVGLRSVKSGDMALIPDLQTGFIDPFWEMPTLSFLCNTVEAESKNPFNRDPRLIAKKAEKFLLTSGVADESRWGPEFEFYIFDKASYENTCNSASYKFDSDSAVWNSGNNQRAYQLPLHGGYHAIPPADRYFDIRSKIVTELENIGIPIKYHHHEVGGPGQCEIETPMLSILSAADAVMCIKYFTRMVAFREGKVATFLPKPLFGEAGNGMHFHIQLLRTSNNLFYEAFTPSSLSENALFFIGGLLTHAPSVLAWTNPTTNSYRRLVPGYEAPTSCIFSRGNRSAAIRIPAYATKANQVRFEFRPPDATCNPYLAMSAMLLAGIDGIIKKIDPTRAGFGPINEDIFTWSAEKRATIKSLPCSLLEAVQALESDHQYLLAGDVFDKEMINDWISTKRNEDDDLRKRPHPFEIQRYFDL